MRILHLVISFLFLSCTLVFAQKSLPTTVFHRHIQTCHYIGTVEEDYVIKMYGDSTIDIEKFISSYKDQYNSVIRVVYSGRYIKKNDSVFVNYSSQSKSINYKTLPTIKTLEEPPSLYTKYPSSTFVLSKNSILPATGTFPILEKTTILKVSSIGIPR
jgi:hypothetical protein